MLNCVFAMLFFVIYATIQDNCLLIYRRLIDNQRDITRSYFLYLCTKSFNENHNNWKRGLIIKVVIQSCKSKKDRQYNDQRLKKKGQTMIYKTLHRQLKIQ